MNNLTPQFKITLSILFLVIFCSIDSFWFGLLFVVLTIWFSLSGLFDLLDGEKRN